MSETTVVDVVFDGPPSHESGRFVEVENIEGASISAGQWIEREDGLWALRLELANAERVATRRAHVTRCRHGGWHANMAGPCFATQQEAVAYRDLPDWQKADR